jgi:hypothetical protein
MFDCGECDTSRFSSASRFPKHRRCVRTAKRQSSANQMISCNPRYKPTPHTLPSVFKTRCHSGTKTIVNTDKIVA